MSRVDTLTKLHIRTVEDCDINWMDVIAFSLATAVNKLPPEDFAQLLIDIREHFDAVKAGQEMREAS